MTSTHSDPNAAAPPSSATDRLIRFFLDNRLVVLLLLLLILGWGYRVMPFDVESPHIPRDPIPVDAIPDIGENQQVVFTEWPGRSPQDVENQITYPLTTVLQGTAGFKTIRAYSMFGFSLVYVIFDDEHDFYWCRSRLLEKMNVAQQMLPEGVTPSLGPDATALGQVFWYTLEGSNGGFDPMRLRSIQDWYVRWALQGIEGVSEVASVGGFVREYQVDVDPQALLAHNVRLQDVFMALQSGNIDVGAETVEWNGVEYVVRAKGFLRGVEDIENAVLRAVDNVPILVKNVARVAIGPALRRGVLDKAGTEAVGGVVLVRYGANPMEVIDRVKARIEELSPGLPTTTLPDGTASQVRIVPFYDRTQLIHETLDTLKDALFEQILVTTFVVLLFLRHVRSCIVISLTMPLAVMICFTLMKITGVDSNLMSLGGIAIAIGTMVDMGIILTENIVRHLEREGQSKPLADVVYQASREIGSAVTTAILMTVIAFLPVFALEGPEGKLFRPLAFTKTFALLGSLLVAMFVLPTLAVLVFTPSGRRSGRLRAAIPIGWIAGAVALVAWGWNWAGVAAAVYGGIAIVEGYLPPSTGRRLGSVMSFLVMAVVVVLLTQHWMPLGPGHGFLRNLVIVLGINLAWASVRVVFIDFYPRLLRQFLAHKFLFLSVPGALVVLGIVVWLGFGRVFSWLPHPTISGPGAAGIYEKLWVGASHEFPGLGREFMPPLDEGSFLYMPTLMPHAGISAAMEVLSEQDKAFQAIPEVESVVGKIGRAETAMDPAPLSMIETLILYKTEYKLDPVTREPILDDQGQPIRQWREHIRSSDDIWREIQKAAEFPGVTGAPRLQPISARLVMLQSGMRAPMGVKVFGSDLQQIESVGLQIADILRTVPGVAKDAIIPDRTIGKPYWEINIDRERIARHGMNIRDVQDVIEMALGGIRATTTIERRERYPVRVRYPRELRDSVEEMERILVPGSDGQQVPLRQLVQIEYVRGPEDIKSENNFLVAYVLFDKLPEFAEVDIVEHADRALRSKIAAGEFVLPPGVHYKFAGNYENQVRFQARLSIILPVSMLLLFLLLYFEFRSVPVSLIVFSGIPVAWAGGFIGLWLVAEPWFCNFDVFGVNVRDLLHFHPYHLSAAVWVGFIALFSVTTDDGVVLATYLNQECARRPIRGIADIREAVVTAGVQRVRPCLMTSATTVLSLMPVLTSNGRGADVMIPIALPAIGGLTIELLSLFVLPVCYCMMKEITWRWSGNREHLAVPAVANV